MRQFPVFDFLVLDGEFGPFAYRRLLSSFSRTKETPHRSADEVRSLATGICFFFFRWRRDMVIGLLLLCDEFLTAPQHVFCSFMYLEAYMVLYSLIMTCWQVHHHRLQELSWRWCVVIVVLDSNVLGNDGLVGLSPAGQQHPGLGGGQVRPCFLVS